MACPSNEAFLVDLQVHTEQSEARALGTSAQHPVQARSQACHSLLLHDPTSKSCAGLGLPMLFLPCNELYVLS